MNKIKKVIIARERDLGGFSVRRMLPDAEQQMVGSFIFFDHMGPADFSIGQGIDVRPHPHISLATVTYLFEGKIRHCDSLGNDQLIEPGAINWMTAGWGIVHSERTPEDLRATGSRLSGIQCWVALPKESEDIAPSFRHYSAEVIPEFNINQTKVKLLLGAMFGYKSPVVVNSDLFYLDIQLQKGIKFDVPLQGQECAVYVVQGNVIIDDQVIAANSMVVLQNDESFTIDPTEDTRLLILGGKPLEKRFIYWNFVSSSEEKIEQAKLAWENGPGEAGSRFPKIPNDHEDYIPLPQVPKDKNPKGTIM
jgi:redox-sensitive bicupin YhaK (pirin superfamily)